MYLYDDDVISGSRGVLFETGIMMKMILTMLFATVCEVLETFESKCALVPPTITNLRKKSSMNSLSCTFRKGLNEHYDRNTMDFLITNHKWL